MSSAVAEDDDVDVLFSEQGFGRWKISNRILLLLAILISNMT